MTFDVANKMPDNAHDSSMGVFGFPLRLWYLPPRSIHAC